MQIWPGHISKRYYYFSPESRPHSSRLLTTVCNTIYTVAVHSLPFGAEYLTDPDLNYLADSDLSRSELFCQIMITDYRTKFGVSSNCVLQFLKATILTLEKHVHVPVMLNTTEEHYKSIERYRYKVK